MEQPVGYMVPGERFFHIVGTCCSKGEGLTPIYKVNIAPYRQNCCSCGKPVVEGRPNWPELYDSPAEPIEVK